MVSKFAIFESVAVAMIVVIVLAVGCTDPPTPPTPTSTPTPNPVELLSTCVDDCELLYIGTARYLPCVSVCVDEYKELGGE